ncbi:hypothetical protein ABPG75_007533 [Micractinium tetrahymenae]
MIAAAAAGPGSRNLALVMLGDCMLGRVVDESLTALPGQLERVWGDTLPLLRGGMARPGEGQLVAANLECAVTDEEKKDEKEFNFRLSPANAAALTNAHLAFVSLANNHSLDYREAGLAETQRVLHASGIVYAGVGRPAEAAAPALLERAGLKLAFLSYSDHYDRWAATDDRSGINYIDPEGFSEATLAAQLAAAREAGADLVVVFIHWGPNWRWLPSAAIRRLGRAFIDCGADIVFGHSSHHIQGIEVYRQRPIVYGAGGFVDDYRLDEDFRNDLGFLYCCHISDGIPAELELVPTRIVHTGQSSGQPRYLSEVRTATKRDARWLRSRLRELCRVLGTRVFDGQGERLAIPLRGSGGSNGAEEERQGGGSTAGGGRGGTGGSGGRAFLARLLGLNMGP